MNPRVINPLSPQAGRGSMHSLPLTQQTAICSLEGMKIVAVATPAERAIVRRRGKRNARQGRRSDHRLRCLGRRRRLEPCRNEDAYPLPGAGRLGEADRLPVERAGLGSAVLQRFRHQSQSPRAADRLSDQRRQFADQDRQLQRRRRQHHHVHGALPAPASVRFQGADPRRRRRRLADRLRHARAVLCRERPHDGRLRACRRSGLSAERAADAAVAARQVRRPLRQGDEPARLALVGVRLDHCDGGL